MTFGTDVVRAPTPGGLATVSPVRLGSEQIELLKRTIAAGTTDDELALFVAVCNRTGLDPFARQIHCVKRGRAGDQVMSIQTGIDGFRLLAERTGKFRGRVGPWWCGSDGRWLDIWLSETPPAAARVGVLRDGLDEPVYAVAVYREFVQMTTDRAGNRVPNRMWATMPALMLAKTAEAQALRATFPAELSGLYTPDEMGASVDMLPPLGWSTISDAQEGRRQLRARIDTLNADQRSDAASWWHAEQTEWRQMTRAQFDAYSRWLDTLTGVDPDDDDPGPDGPGGGVPDHDVVTGEVIATEPGTLGVPRPNPDDPAEAPFQTDQLAEARARRDVWEPRALRKLAKNLELTADDLQMLVQGVTRLRTRLLASCDETERQVLWQRLRDIGQNRAWLDQYRDHVARAQAQAAHPGGASA